MPLTDDIQLPTEQELTVPEINVSSPVLRASATHFGKYCDDQCKEFMLCRSEERDPRKCINEGKAVTSCALNFYQKVKATCRDELDTFAKCIEWQSHDMKFWYCRKEQAIFDQCMLDKMGIEKPYLGYFTQVRLHDSKRPKPIPQVPKWPDPTPGLPEDYPREPARHGTREWFYA